MDASSTKRKSNKKSAQRELVQASNQVVNYIQSWTQKQTKEISVNTTQFPVCMPIGKNRWQVGKFTVERVSEFCWRVYNVTGDLVHEFTLKQAAVLYSALTHIKRTHTADQILSLDKILGQLEADAAIYNRMLRSAERKKDSDAIDLYNARYSKIQGRIDQARNDLQKSLNQAKYIKIWDKPL